MALHRFSAIRGHRAQVSALSRLILRGTPGHAYLFEGPEGVGKDVVAQALLARLACTRADPTSAEPCGTCPSCMAFLRGDHPDVTRLQKDGATIKIDQVRTAVKRLPGVSVQTAQLPPQAFMQDRDTWISGGDMFQTAASSRRKDGDSSSLVGEVFKAVSGGG